MRLGLLNGSRERRHPLIFRPAAARSSPRLRRPRVLRPEGAYFAQHVGPGSAFELIEFFRGPQEETRHRHPDDEVAAARAAGLEIVDLQTARTRIVIHDVAAVVYLLRKLIWWVPGFTVENHRARLRDLHDLIQSDGPFIAHSTRHRIAPSVAAPQLHPVG